MSWCDGRLDAGLRYAEAAVGAGCAEGHEICELAPSWHVALLIKARKLEDGRRALDKFEARECGAGAVAERMVATVRVFRGELLFVSGQTEAGLAEVDAGLELAVRCGARSLLPNGYVAMALGALRRADMRTCQQFVDKLTGEALIGYFGQAAGAWVTAQAAEARNGVHSAAGLIAGIVTNTQVLRQLLVSEPAALSWLVRACGKLNAHDLARIAVRAACLLSAEQPGFPVVRASALHATGLLEGEAGPLWEAAGLYADQWCRASALEDLAGLLTARGSEREKTIRFLESALSGYTAVGATRDASRVVNKLRNFGVRRGAIRTTERDGIPRNGLTDTEFAVAELVSQGYTNNEVGRQLFISRHTVAFHLKKVYQKMSVASRVELAAIWKQMQ